MLFREVDEDLAPFPFVDRPDWATELKASSDRGDPGVLGLARERVVVASAIATTLRIPLDVFVVGTKLGLRGTKNLEFPRSE